MGNKSPERSFRRQSVLMNGPFCGINIDQSNCRQRVLCFPPPFPPPPPPMFLMPPMGPIPLMPPMARMPIMPPMAPIPVMPPRPVFKNSQNSRPVNNSPKYVRKKPTYRRYETPEHLKEIEEAYKDKDLSGSNVDISIIS